MKQIPEQITEIIKKLEDAGFEAFLVGGCVRDLLRNKEPKDWDITTNAVPEEIQTIFPDSFYENNFGTVGVKISATDKDNVTHETENLVIHETKEADEPKEAKEIVEITPYRQETTYSDNRHPDSVSFSKNIEDDLMRRDFTINAIAYSPTKGKIIDPHKGQEDLASELIKAVGDADQRFNEDALRMMRAIRFSAQFGYTIESETLNAIANNSDLIKKISKERVRDEFVKMIMSDNPMVGMVMLEKVNILGHILPVFSKTIGVSQNKQAHKYDVWEHLLRSLQHAADKNYSLEIRVAALFHDISKPETKRTSKSGTTFYGHEVVGAKVTRETLNSLKFPKEFVETVSNLVRWHMFFSDPDQITLSAVRRITTKVGKEHIEDLMNLRICDRIGTGRPKEQPYRFRKYKSMIDEALRDPLTVGMLKIDGEILIKDVKVEPGPKMGFILHALLDEVLENPELNTEEYLLKRAKELKDLDIKELEVLGKKGKRRAEDEDQELIKDIRKKHNVN